MISEDKIKRKVTVILATDVVGYSAQMEKNENQTLQTLKTCRSIIDSLIAEHHGRIFNTAGDSVLAEFPSAVEAVLCATEFQGTIKERNDSLDTEAGQMEFRVGINMGDVVIEGDNLYGDGINVAARLEALAQSGGVCISKNVHEIVQKKIDLDFTDLGEQKVKDTVVHAVDVLLEGTAPRKVPTSQQISRAAPWKKYTAVFIVAALIAGSAVWWQTQPDFEPADQAKFAYELPDKPSIAVLPFDNLSGDPTQDYLGDGLTDSIIAVLATSPNLFVIARNSSFTYKGKPAKVQEVAEQLGVRYVLEGSVQQSGEKLRVTAKLVDALDGMHLWVERYDRELDDLFALQDDITEHISKELEIGLAVGEQGKNWHKEINDPKMFRLMVEARARFQTNSVEGNKDAERLFTEVYERDPDGALGNGVMGWVYFQKVLIGLSKDPGNDLAMARKHAEKSIASGEFANAFALYAILELWAKDYDSALSYIDHALEIGASEADLLATAGSVKFQSGEPHEAVALTKRAMRLNPYHAPFVAINLGYSYLMIGKYDEADAVFESVLSGSAKTGRAIIDALRGLSVTAVFRGDMATAREQFMKMIEIDPKASVEVLMRRYHVWKDQAFLKQFLDALRALGLPEKLPDA